GHVYHQYVVRGSGRDDLMAHLRRRGVGTLIHYPVPVHLQPAYRDRVPLSARGLAVSESAAREVLSLPLYPQLADGDVQQVIDAVRACSPPAPRPRRRGSSAPTSTPAISRAGLRWSNRCAVIVHRSDFGSSAWTSARTKPCKPGPRPS